MARSEAGGGRAAAPVRHSRSRSRRKRRACCTRATSAACSSAARPSTRCSEAYQAVVAQCAQGRLHARRRRAGAADDLGHCRGLRGHHRRSALRAGDLLRPRRHFRRAPARHGDRDGAAVARRRLAHDPRRQGGADPRRRARPPPRRHRGAGGRCWSISATSRSPMRGRFRALDLNPIIVERPARCGRIAIEPIGRRRAPPPTPPSNACKRAWKGRTMSYKDLMYERRGPHRDHHAQPPRTDERAHARSRGRAAPRLRRGRRRPRRCG